MKYIVTLNEDEGTEEMFLFPRDVNHDCMAEMVLRLRDQTTGNWKRPKRTLVSAGFVDGGVCVGYSMTLNLRSRTEDTKLLKLQ